MLTMIRHHDDTYAYEPLTRRWSTPRLDYEQAPAHEKLDLHTRVAAASVRTAVITGLAAGILHHIPILNHTNQVVVHLTLPGRQQPPPRSQWENSILRYRYAVLPDTDICLIGGNRVTSLARTFTDICTINGELEGLAFLEAALHMGHSKQEFQAYIDQNDHRWGMVRAQKVLDQALYGIESVYETYARYIITTMLPALQVDPQAIIPIPSRWYYEGFSRRRVDLLIEQFIIIEIDGRIKYQQSQDKLIEVLSDQVYREKHLIRHGYHVLRFAPWELKTLLIPTLTQTLDMLHCDHAPDVHQIPNLQAGHPSWDNRLAAA